MKSARTLKRTAESEKRRKQLVLICESLPEAEAAPLGHGHLSFKVRKKIFGYYCFDHHGDGRIALWCKAAPGEQGRLVEDDPRRFFAPPYLGPRGWIAMRLDVGRTVNWSEVTYLVRTAYRLTAPRKLAGQLE